MNLTELEQQAIGSPINLADGHPRHALTPSQKRLVAHLPDLFETALSDDFEELEAGAQRSFFAALGQHSAPIEEGRVLSVYSSSVATMVLASMLAAEEHEVALLNPTFDNIHALISQRVPVMPISEEEVAAGDLKRVIERGASCVFVTTPNNPTGWHLDAAQLARLAEICAGNRLLLCLDTSFRGHDTRTQFDCYEILARSGVEYVVIEDTGKIWPVAELKLGFMVSSAGMARAAEHLLSDTLLTVSPLILKLVEKLSDDGADGGFEQLHKLVAANREQVLLATAATPGMTTYNPDSRIGVSVIDFGVSDEASRVLGRLREQGVHLLPVSQFFWAEPGDGARFLRVALTRDEEVLSRALEKLVNTFNESSGRGCGR